MSVRDAILRGSARAAELHAELGTRDKSRDGSQPVDVIDAIHQMGIALLFRPLEKLLGAYIPQKSSPGVVITSERSLHIQRFTAAHELGHHALGHQGASVDEEVGFVARRQSANRDLGEVEADAFASEFLMPKWLIVAIARRNKWVQGDLRKQENLYQLSLRLGTSYSATIWALHSNDLLTYAESAALVKLPPKNAKQALLKSHAPESWHSDTWRITEADQDAHLIGNPEDNLLFDLRENPSTGFIWDLKCFEEAGLQVDVESRREEPEAARYGAAVRRRIMAHGQGDVHLRLVEKRPWSHSQDAASSFSLDLVLHGKEQLGLPRHLRHAS